MILAALTLGVHLASVHVPARDGQQNVNPGIYLRTEDGLTAGLYRNTLSRTSAYLGLTADAGPFSLTAGLISGYQTKRRGATCAEAKVTVRRDIGQCWIDEGYSRGAVTPFLAPSVRLPLADQWAGRLTYLPSIGDTNRSSAVHFSIERTFP